MLEVRPKPKMPQLSFLTPQELHCCRKESFKPACTTSCRAEHFRTMARSLMLQEQHLMERRSPVETAAEASLHIAVRTIFFLNLVIAAGTSAISLTSARLV